MAAHMQVVVFDLNKAVTDPDFVVARWPFPEAVAPSTSSFLNDIVLDLDRNMA